MSGELVLTDPIERLHRLGNQRDLAVVFQVELRQSTKCMDRDHRQVDDADPGIDLPVNGTKAQAEN